MEVRPEQLKNAPLPILVTKLGIVMEVRFEQLWNALLPILVTELGIVMEVRPVHPLNAFAAIRVTVHIIPLGSVIVLGIVIASDALAFTITVASVTLVV